MEQEIVAASSGSLEEQIRFKKQIEDELSKRVAIALPETPPLEKQKKRRDALKSKQQIDYERLNDHVDFNEKRPLLHDKDEIIQQAKSRMYVDLGWKSRLLKINEDQPELQEDENIGQIDQSRTYRLYSPSDRPAHVQDYGSSTSYLTPIQDINIKPLLPAPGLVTTILTAPEPLYTSIPYVLGSRTFDNQVTPYTQKLRGLGVVFDSEKSAREQDKIIPSNELIAPPLLFESRFESGNLRQARRVGQFEYELVLKTDVFTKRHTQWYYFRVENMLPDVIYKFRIVNLLKRDSLYNHGMRPLFYSEKQASIDQKGWYRLGHHISYSRNIQHLLCPLLNREMIYYELEWQIEFPFSDDTCYLAHCYPFTHSDLRDDIKRITNDKRKKRLGKNEVLCKTRGGNDCFCMTITDPDVAVKLKKFVIVSARVHPGESNSSWMCKGLYEFLTSDHPDAQELRSRFIFKIVPMLNPDGVIVGNYRCSLQAKDLNRNYRRPKNNSFPTIHSIKQLVQTCQRLSQVFVYCDFHGHSRKSNVFMYGNSSNDPDESPSIQQFISVRSLPFIISQLNGEMFNFNACKFAIRRCKEATGRVVMYREFSIENCYTMEATFSGTRKDTDGARHFNQKDFMDAGVIFAQGVLQLDKIYQDRQLQTELLISITKHITQQYLSAPRNRSLLPGMSRYTLAAMKQNSSVESESGDAEGSADKASSTLDSDDSDQSDSESPSTNHRRSDGSTNQSDNSISSIFSSRLQNVLEEASQVDFNSPDALNQCLGLLGNFSQQLGRAQSDSSDSDSDPESEQKIPQHVIRKQKKSQKNNKKKKQSKKDAKLMRSRSDSQSKFKSKLGSTSLKPAFHSTHLSGLSLDIIHDTREDKSKTSHANQFKVLPEISKTKSNTETTLVHSNFDHFNQKSEAFSFTLTDKKKEDLKSTEPYNPYQGRSNGGIPCFSEERCIERATKRMAELQSKMDENPPDPSLPFDYDGYLGELQRYDAHIRALNTHRLQAKQVQEYLKNSIRMLTHSCLPEIGSAVTSDSEADLNGQEYMEIIETRKNMSPKKSISASSVDVSRRKVPGPPSIPSRDRDIRLVNSGNRWQWIPSQSTQPLVEQLTWSLPSQQNNQTNRPLKSRSILVGQKVNKSHSVPNNTSRKHPNAEKQKPTSLSGALRVHPLHQPFE